MNRLAVYPGSFDPITNGHLDILTRARSLFDRVIIAVGISVHKGGLFTTQERMSLLEEVVGHDPGVEVCCFNGLLTDYARSRKAAAIVRGLRAVADFEYEFQLALMNRKLAGEIDTVFLMTDQRNFYVSSSLVKEIARFGGDVADFVPAAVRRALEAKFTSA